MFHINNGATMLASAYALTISIYELYRTHALLKQNRTIKTEDTGIPIALMLTILATGSILTLQPSEYEITMGLIFVSLTVILTIINFKYKKRGVTNG